MKNKAHATVLNRLVARYQGTPTNQNLIDIVAGPLQIAVETTATLSRNLPELLKLEGAVYIAVTNQESLAEAMQLTDSTNLGVMDSRGDVVKPAT
jgi:hypothetical protein